ncbi:MAG TPA: hypothetical protein VHQ22_20870 [Terriglobales bacterium]|nr:hypothetical protein [Terriglobales bacterium]
MEKKNTSPPNLGTAKSPIDFGQGNYAYRRDGRWHYRNADTMRRFGRKFVDAKDHDLIMELESRGYQILYPAHECVDRPHLPCPACERTALRATRTA